MRYLGLDYGSKTVGVALCDTASRLPRPLETVRREREKKLRRTLSRIEQIITENEIDELVVGLPLNMDGSEGERALMARSFAEALSRRTGLPVHMEDERLTTVEACELMDKNGIAGRDERESMVDSMAAVVILEEFLCRK